MRSCVLYTGPPLPDARERRPPEAPPCGRPRPPHSAHHGPLPRHPRQPSGRLRSLRRRGRQDWRRGTALGRRRRRGPRRRGGWDPLAVQHGPNVVQVVVLKLVLQSYAVVVRFRARKGRDLLTSPGEPLRVSRILHCKVGQSQERLWINSAQVLLCTSEREGVRAIKGRETKARHSTGRLRVVRRSEGEKGRKRGGC